MDDMSGAGIGSWHKTFAFIEAGGSWAVGTEADTAKVLPGDIDEIVQERGSDPLVAPCLSYVDSSDAGNAWIVKKWVKIESTYGE